MSDFCIECSVPMRQRQETFLCDMCTRWQHRTCYTYISGAVYRPSVRESGDIDWHCSNYIDMPTDYCFSELAL